jgi:hypothetical protein
VKFARFAFKITSSFPAANTVAQCIRWAFDFVSGYKHKPIPPDNNMTVSKIIISVQSLLLTEKNDSLNN